MNRIMSTIRTDTDVVIVGGGPAGLAAAIAARLRGLSVTLADAARPPLDKACGEGLMPDGAAALRELGVTIPAHESAAFHGIRFLDENYNPEGRFEAVSGIGLRRTVLHRLLARRAEEVGVTLRWGTQVLWLSSQEVRIGDQPVRARWVIGADGLNSRVRRYAGLEKAWRARPRVGLRMHLRIAPWTDLVEVYWHKLGQAYVTPVASDEICVALVASRAAPIQMGDVPRLFPPLGKLLKDALPADSVNGAVTCSTRLRRVTHGHFALIGDASGSVDAVTGEGLSIAFRQALALGDALARGDLAGYEAAHRRIMRMPQMMARLLLLMDGRERLRRTTFRVLAAHPQLFSRLLAGHVGAASPSAVLRDVAGLAGRALVAGALPGPGKIA
jgi:flavin-dependent dehydrogenase